MNWRMGIVIGVAGFVLLSGAWVTNCAAEDIHITVLDPKQLDVISHQLDVIDKKLTFLQDSINQLQAQNQEQFQDTFNLIASKGDTLSAFFAESLDNEFDDQRTGIANELTTCGDRMNRRKVPLSESDAGKLRECLAKLKNIAMNESQRRGLTLSGFSIDKQSLSRIKIREKYPSTLVGAVFLIQAVANRTLPDFDEAMNSDVWNTAVQAYVDLLYLVPEFKDRVVAQDDLSTLRRLGMKLKARIDQFDEIPVVRDKLKDYSEIFNLAVWQRLDILRDIVDDLYGTQLKLIIPDAFIAGYDLEQSLIATRCLQKMPNFFTKYYDIDDQDGYLVRACAEGNAIDFQKAGIGILLMQLDQRDLVFAADALKMVDWQFETVQTLTRSSTTGRTDPCAQDEPGHHVPCPSRTLYIEKGLGTVVVRYNAHLRKRDGTISDKIIAYYEGSQPAANEVQQTSTDRSAATAYVENYQAEMIRSVRARLTAIKAVGADFPTRGNSWKNLTTVGDIRDDVRVAAELARGQIYHDPRASSPPVALGAAGQAALDELHRDQGAADRKVRIVRPTESVHAAHLRIAAWRLRVCRVSFASGQGL